MAVTDLEDFKRQYYSIVDQVALNMWKGDNEACVRLNTQLDNLMEEASRSGTDITGFPSSKDEGYLTRPVNAEIVAFHGAYIFGYDPEIYPDIDDLDISDASKDEIRATGFVAAFERMRNSEKQEEFLYYYGVVQEMSEGLDGKEINNPEFGEARGVFATLKEKIPELGGDDFKSVGSETDHDDASSVDSGMGDIDITQLKGALEEAEEEYNKSVVKPIVGTVEEERGRESIERRSSNISSITTEGKASDASLLGREGSSKPSVRESVVVERGVSSPAALESGRTAQQPKPKDKISFEQVKEKVARDILKVAGVNEAQINRIMNNPEARNARTAIMKRADKALENIGVKESNIKGFGAEKALKNIKDGDIKDEVKKQSKEFIAQVGRVGSWSIDGRDMRGKGQLHDKYTKQANKMTGQAFGENAEKALAYETAKDERWRITSLAYNIVRLPLRMFNDRPDDKPILKPWQTAMIGLVAAVILAYPFGRILLACCMAKAVKNGIYDESKLQAWVNNTFYVDKSLPEKFNAEALKEVGVQKILEVPAPIVEVRNPVESLVQSPVRETVVAEPNLAMQREVAAITRPLAEARVRMNAESVPVPTSRVGGAVGELERKRRDSSSSMSMM